MTLLSNRESLLISYRKEYIKFTEMILYVTNSHEVVI